VIGSGGGLPTTGASIQLTSVSGCGSALDLRFSCSVFFGKKELPVSLVYQPLGRVLANWRKSEYPHREMCHEKVGKSTKRCSQCAAGLATQACLWIAKICQNHRFPIASPGYGQAEDDKSVSKPSLGRPLPAVVENLARITGMHISIRKAERFREFL